jgi:tetratricopeptide (TPR) repeat protein
MQRLVIFYVCVFICTLGFSQAFDDYLFDGNYYLKEKNYEAAIKSYSKAIKMYPGHSRALTNRGTCYYGLGKYDLALADYDKVISGKNKDVNINSYRMYTLIKLERYKEALENADLLMTIDTAKLSFYLIHSGWLKVKLGRRDEGCEDFSKAKALGNIDGSKYKRKFCINQTKSGEYLWLFWSEIGDWKHEYAEENDYLGYLEIYHDGENADKWTEQGMMIVEKNQDIPLHKQMYTMYYGLLERCPTAKLKFIETDLSTQYPYIIYSITIPKAGGTDLSLSQIHYTVQGKVNQHTNVITIKKKKFTKKEEEKWVDFFKTSIITYKP